MPGYLCKNTTSNNKDNIHPPEYRNSIITHSEKINFIHVVDKNVKKKLWTSSRTVKMISEDCKHKKLNEIMKTI